MKVTPFSSDLVTLAIQHKCFLQALHSLGVSLETPSVESLRRYRDLWLPLVASTDKEEKLIPPPDVAWLWHCHRLAPSVYQRYIVEKFGKGEGDFSLEANPPFALQTQDTETDGLMCEAAEATRHRWLQLYPNDPFFLDHNIPLKEEAQTEKLLCGFDLVGSTERQGAFLWQVSGERFDDVDFLREAVDNYHKFLLLRPKANGTILVPTYQIDLMWHTHILSSLRKYTKDCRAITGSALHHDDSLTDRSEGGVLDVSFRATKALWRKEFGEEYVVDGGMYRGEPPEEYNRRDWDSREIWVATIEHDLDLVGKVGASSTGVSAPTEWAVVGGKTSTGEDAFLPTTTNYPELKCLPRRKGYVLGKASSGEIGYYHIETKEAHEIVIPRLEKSVKKLELALNWEKCVPCCFDRKSFPDRERKLEETKDAMEVMKARHEAPRPSGELPKGSKNVSSYIDHSGSWLYPQAIWVGGGGACGGGVACDGGALGGGFFGGGCGGGGCGGGGCGGGGCGGGGC